jgi:hypothetical protein
VIRYFSLFIAFGLFVLAPSPAKACAKHAKYVLKECITVVVDHPIQIVLCEWNPKSTQYKHHIRRHGVHTHRRSVMWRGRAAHIYRGR